MGEEGIWWTTEKLYDDLDAHTVLSILCADDSYFMRYVDDENYASIRCVKD
jgi:hypothetical protein